MKLHIKRKVIGDMKYCYQIFDGENHISTQKSPSLAKAFVLGYNAGKETGQ